MTQRPPPAGALSRCVGLCVFTVLLGLALPPRVALAERACGDDELDLFDETATLAENLEERAAGGVSIEPMLIKATIDMLNQLSSCQGRLGRRALLFLARMHTVSGDTESEQLALQVLRQRDLSPEELKDLETRYPPDSKRREAAVEPPPHDAEANGRLGVAEVELKRRGQDLQVVAFTDEAEAVRSMVVRWNPTGASWRQVVIEPKSDGGGRDRFAARLQIPAQGVCMVQITAHRRRAGPVTLPEFTVDTYDMGDDTIRREFAVSSKAVLKADVWSSVSRRAVRVTLRPHGTGLRVTIASNVDDGIRWGTIRWNPIGGGWSSKAVGPQATDSGALGHAANVHIPKAGPCIFEIVLGGPEWDDVRLPVFTIDTAGMGTRPVARTFTGADISWARD